MRTSKNGLWKFAIYISGIFLLALVGGVFLPVRSNIGPQGALIIYFSVLAFSLFVILFPNVTAFASTQFSDYLQSQWPRLMVGALTTLAAGTGLLAAQFWAAEPSYIMGILLTGIGVSVVGIFVLYQAMS